MKHVLFICHVDTWLHARFVLTKYGNAVFAESLFKAESELICNIYEKKKKKKKMKR